MRRNYAKGIISVECISFSRSIIFCGVMIIAGAVFALVEAGIVVHWDCKAVMHTAAVGYACVIC